MKEWKEEEIIYLIELNKSGYTNKEISKILDRTPKAIIVKNQRLGIKSNVKNLHITKKCECCGKEFDSLVNEHRKYCSKSCSAKITNKIPKRKITNLKNRSFRYNDDIVEILCLNCGKKMTNNRNNFCSQECHIEYKKNKNFKKIENGDITLTHRQYKKYLIHKHGEKCMECGWNKKNPVTGNVPIELEHIDGNSENNSLSNLKLLCPNCHSLTPTYKALNKGNGRHNRMQRYNDNKSY